MNVLIVGKTKMSGNFRCIGGLLPNGKSVRLIKPHGQWDTSSKFDIGDIWDIEFTQITELVAPHTEDVMVTKRSYVKDQEQLTQRILSSITPWRGGIDQVFGGQLEFTGNSNGYISHAGGVPNYSTWFWVPDRDLTLRADGKHYDYPGVYSDKGMSYVGEPDAIPVIPAGRLVRISLARWWKPQGIDNLEERCYLQLSGWF
ncbi:dual OB domain-containing protein [Gluconacetobacter sp. Hr-1-5]|uniref:dual OB domain-containing protein n=1 Tax=Gluconacetobacter sp. Hr-1-5 TaxID=3395370 RepID=UPI003B52E307